MEYTTKYLFVNEPMPKFQKKLDELTEKGFHPHLDHYVHMDGENEDEAYVSQIFVNNRFPIVEKGNE